MRTTIVRIVIGLLLLSFAACSEKQKPANMDAFGEKVDMKQPPPPPKLPNNKPDDKPPE